MNNHHPKTKKYFTATQVHSTTDSAEPVVHSTTSNTQSNAKFDSSTSQASTYASTDATNLTSEPSDIASSTETNSTTPNQHHHQHNLAPNQGEEASPVQDKETATASTSSATNATHATTSTATTASQKKTKQVFHASEATKFTIDDEREIQTGTDYASTASLESSFSSADNDNYQYRDLGNLNQPLSSKITKKFIIVAVILYLLLLGFLVQYVHGIYQYFSSFILSELLYNLALGSITLVILVYITKQITTIVKFKRSIAHRQLADQYQTILTQSSTLPQHELDAKLQSVGGAVSSPNFVSQLVASLHLPINSVLLQAYQQQHSDYTTPQQELQLFRTSILQKLDAQAYEVINRNAAQEALITGISPYAVFDMAFMLWRNQVMITQIAKIYGVEVNAVTKMELFTSLMFNVLVAGATELAHDLAVNYVSTGILGKVSAKAAQGIGLGLLTARLGLQAVAALRPMAQLPDEQKSLAHFVPSITKQVTKMIMTADKDAGSTADVRTATTKDARTKVRK